MIVLISLVLSTNQRDIVFFTKKRAYLPLRTQILHCDGAPGPQAITFSASAHGSSSDVDFNLSGENPRCLPPPPLNNPARGSDSASAGGMASCGCGNLSKGCFREKSSFPLLGRSVPLSGLGKTSGCLGNSGSFGLGGGDGLTSVGAGARPSVSADTFSSRSNSLISCSRVKS